jgi:predicted nucleic acid-binding protein
VTLVDTNVLLDVVTDDPIWADWSIRQLDAASLKGPLAINDIVYAEVSVRFERIEDVEEVLEESAIAIAPIPREALFLAAKIFQRYRAAGGARQSVLPDFFIGAQAAVAGLPLLTRDARRYRTYFPSLSLIAP